MIRYWNFKKYFEFNRVTDIMISGELEKKQMHSRVPILRVKRSGKKLVPRQLKLHFYHPNSDKI